jgi:hypothetical protein
VRRLALATAVAVAASLPAAHAAVAAPSGGSSSGSATTLTGTVTTVIREQHRGAGSSAKVHGPERQRVLHTGTRVVPLAKGSLSRVRDGATVRVRAQQTSGGATVLSSTTLAEGTAGTGSGTTGSGMTTQGTTTERATAGAATAPTVHQVFAAVVIPQGLGSLPAPTETAVREAVDTASSYWSSQTGGQVAFTTAMVLPAYTSDYACGGDNVMAMWDEALVKINGQLKRMGDTQTDPQAVGNHVLLVAPKGADRYDCDYGIANLGGLASDGNVAFVSDLNQSLVSHELGHNLGLDHSNGLRCDGKQDAAYAAGSFTGCYQDPYDDLLDVMGFSGQTFGEGNLNAVHLDGMGLLPTAVTVAPGSATTTHRIAPLSGDPTQVRALKITDPNGVRYFVDYRTSSGRDAVAATNPYRPALGVEVLREDPSASGPSAGSYLLDPSPTSLSSTDYTRVLPVGGVFRAASGKLSIAVTGLDSSGASIRVYNGTPGPAVPATVSNTTVSSAYYGTAYTSWTKVLDQYGKPRPGQRVYLQKLAGGSSTWSAVGSAVTNSYGVASYRYTNTSSGSYRWVTPSTAGVTARYSTKRSTTSRLKVSMYQPATSLKRYSYLNAKGTVTSAPSRVAYLQYKYGTGPWKTGPRLSVSGTTVSGRLKMSSRGTFYTRVYVAAGPGYASNVSSAFKTTVW